MEARRMSKDDHLYLSNIRDFNKKREEEIIEKYASDAEHVQDVMSNVSLNLENFNETAIKLMFTTQGQQKKALQDAKGLKKVKADQLSEMQKEAQDFNENWQAIQEDFVKSQISDINQYLND